MVGFTPRRGDFGEWRTGARRKPCEQDLAHYLVMRAGSGDSYASFAGDTSALVMPGLVVSLQSARAEAERLRSRESLERIRQLVFSQLAARGIL